MKPKTNIYGAAQQVDKNYGTDIPARKLKWIRKTLKRLYDHFQPEIGTKL